MSEERKEDLGACLKWVKDRRGRDVVEVRWVWPDGTNYRRWIKSLKIAKTLRARKEAAFDEGRWREFRESLTKPTDRIENDDVKVEIFAWEYYYKRWCLVEHESGDDFYKKEIKNIVRIVGDRSMKNFTRDDANYFRMKRSEEVAKSTVRKGLAVLSGMFTYAIIEKPDKREWIAAHPMFNFTWGPKPPRKQRINLHVTEVKRWVEEALKIDLESGVALGIVSQTALRSKELLFLKRPQFDVRRGCAHEDGCPCQIIIGLSKGHPEGRRVPLTPWAIELAAKLTPVFGSDYLFTRLKTRDRLGRDRLIDVMEQARIAAGITWPARPHDLRHFRALQWLSRGATILDVATWMGHSDIKTTQIYLRHIDEEARERFREANAKELKVVSMKRKTDGEKTEATGS